MFAFTVYKQVHWIAPILCIIPFGMAAYVVIPPSLSRRSSLTLTHRNHNDGGKQRPSIHIHIHLPRARVPPRSSLSHGVQLIHALLSRGGLPAREQAHVQGDDEYGGAGVFGGRDDAYGAVAVSGSVFSLDERCALQGGGLTFCD